MDSRAGELQARGLVNNRVSQRKNERKREKMDKETK